MNKTLDNLRMQLRYCEALEVDLMHRHLGTDMSYWLPKVLEYRKEIEKSIREIIDAT